jgi:hypothetical protein
VNSYRNLSASFECSSVLLSFPSSASLRLLRALTEIVQSEATIICVSDRSLNKLIKLGYRIKINCFVSFGAEKPNININLWN